MLVRALKRPSFCVLTKTNNLLQRILNIDNIFMSVGVPPMGCNDLSDDVEHIVQQNSNQMWLEGCE